MNKKILFSPVGGTDPISEKNMHDGPMIHVMRHYKPDEVHLLMSKEILENDEKDGRYEECIQLLGKTIGCSFDVKRLPHEELVEVQKFEEIYKIFKEELEKIQGEMDETDELLLNISSGTPAMKSALLVLATMMDIRCKCIQVDTPVRAMNEHEHSDDWKDLAVLWELDPDNGYQEGEPNYNRTHEETLPSLNRLKFEEVIKKFVNSYNYHAAAELAMVLNKGTENESVKKYLDKLELADTRQELLAKEVDTMLSSQDREIYCPVRRDKDTRVAYEYMLSLMAKEKRSQYADFIRAITPLVMDLFTAILYKHVNFYLNDYVTSNGYYWDRAKLQGTSFKTILDNAYGGEGKFKFGFVKSDHLRYLIEGLVENQRIIDCVTLLRDIEEKVRNEAAHTMTPITDKIILDLTGYNSKQIVELLKEAFTHTSYNIRAEQWNSYEEMNDDIISAIEGKKHVSE